MTLAAPVSMATSRLVLRKPRVDDARAVFDAYSSDPLVTRFLGWPTHENVDRARTFLQRCDAVRAEGTAYPWAITRDGRLLGMIEARVDGHRAEIGYAISRAAWGHGYTTEAARAVVDWALSQPPIQRVWAYTDVENAASARVLEKAGMARETKLGKWFVPTGFGVPRDCWVYARLKEPRHRVAETRATFAAAVGATPATPPSRQHESVRLETRQLVLRPPTVHDAQAVFARYARDPEVSRYTSWSPHRSIDETREFLLMCEEGWTRGTVCSWAITQRDDGALIGMTDLRLEGHRGEIGYALARDAWGRGYATEAAGAVVGWALALPSMRRVWAVCDVENAASARVLEKAGMTREGRLKAWAAMPAFEAPRDVWCYAAVKEAA